MLRVLGVAGLLGILVASLLGNRRPLEEGAAAPAVIAGIGLDGSKLNVPTAQGRPLVVNIWATWCAPCVGEMPEFAAAARAHEGRVGFLGLATDSPHAHVKQLVERLAIPYDIVAISPSTAHAWNATSLPSTYILDGAGKVVWSVRGAIDRETLEKQLAPLLR